MNYTIGTRLSHPTHGEGVVFGINDSTYRIFFREHGEMEIGKAYTGFTLLEAAPALQTAVELEDVVAAVKNVFDMYYDVADIVEMGERWNKGMLILQPGDAGLKSKEIPIESFFHKIVMLRDRLRVLEQKLNAHTKLTDEDKVEMQQYITRIYGSLTTFNVLFKAKIDHFVGESSKGED
ncbi:MAG: hypothetical protein JNM00_06030 [Flavobacteriales bacterium]|nr:hypothetical protein [Flavobacteriales bacterium]